MPTISRFFGITIRMYFGDHAPPHFHAQYAEDEALIRIDDRSLVEGRLPRRALALVREWAALHALELTENWDRARRRLPLHPIAPLR